jgi:hypothetical protein
MHVFEPKLKTLPEPRKDSQYKSVFGMLLLYKVLFWSVFVCALGLWPQYRFQKGTLLPGETIAGTALQNIDWIRALTGWDSGEYLRLSYTGYAKGEPNCAFFPLWPFLIRICSKLTLGSHFIAGLLLANIISLIALCRLHRFVAGFQGREIANISLILFLAFPSALCFSMIYSESLFLLLVVLFLDGLHNRKYWQLAICSLLLPLARAIGILCVLPAFWQVLESAREHLRECASLPDSRRNFLRLLVPSMSNPGSLAILGLATGFAIYLIIMQLQTGNRWEGFEAQRLFPAHGSVANIFDLGGFGKAFLRIGSVHEMTDSALDRSLFILFVACMPTLFRLNKTWFMYALVSGLIPAMSNSRYLLMCFPIFVVVARRLYLIQEKWVLWYYVIFSVSFQVLLILRYINWYWVG